MRIERSSLVVLVLFLALGSGGCFSRALAPPTSSGPIHGPAVLPSERAGVALSGGMHGAVFGPEVATGALHLRHGLGRQLELTGEGTAFVVAEGDEQVVDHRRDFYAGRLSLRYEIVRHFTAEAGLGGGFSAAGGGFLGPDLGFATGYENPYVVPIVAFRSGVSIPVRPRDLDLSRGDDPAGTDVSRAITTWSFGGRAGFRVPLGQWPKKTWNVPLNLLFLAGATGLVDGRADEDPDDDNLVLCDVVGSIELVF